MKADTVFHIKNRVIRYCINRQIVGVEGRGQAGGVRGEFSRKRADVDVLSCGELQPCASFALAHADKTSALQRTYIPALVGHAGSARNGKSE